MQGPYWLLVVSKWQCELNQRKEASERGGDLGDLSLPIILAHANARSDGMIKGLAARSFRMQRRSDHLG